MDPGGGYGWRAGRAGAGRTFGLSRRADRLSEELQQRPLCVLLLPHQLESFALRERAEDLMSAPGVIAVEPARMSYRAYLKLPLGVGDGVAAIQAKRLPLPGTPRAIVVFHPLQYPLARAIIAIHPDCELWYGGWDPAEAGAEPARRRERLAELHDAADHRSVLDFETTETDPHSANRPLWERMERLGIESGRLGSERPDVMGWR